MTENKRFTIENDIEMKDNWNINKRCYHFGNGFDAKDCCNMLNELQEENQQMKQRLSYAEKVNNGLIDENHRLRLTIIHSSDLNFDINWLKENLKDWNNYE